MYENRETIEEPSEDLQQTLPPLDFGGMFTNLSEGKCVCGRPLGHGPDEEDEEAGAGDPDADASLESKLNEVFGQYYPGAIVHKLKDVNARTDQFLTTADMDVINSALKFTALSFAAMLEKNNASTLPQILASIAIVTRNLREAIGDGVYGLKVLETLGLRMQDTIEEIEKGSTAGIFKAEF